MTSHFVGFGGPLVDMRGAIDMHFHSYPCLFPRLADDVEVALAARDAGMRALLYKCHHESSVSRAANVTSAVSPLSAYGGIVLNSYVGYVNPAAVEACLRLGGKAVWMPTVDAGYHADMHGTTGRYEAQSGGIEVSSGYRCLSDDGELRPEIYEVLEIVAEHDAILGTAHLSPAEIVMLVPAARAAGIERVVVTHPFYKVPGLDLDTLSGLVRQGAIAEFEYCGLSPMWTTATLDAVVHAINILGAANCTLVSDAGQRHNPIAPEALRIFAQSIFERGVSLDNIDVMIKKNPAQLLDLSEETVAPEQDSKTSLIAADLDPIRNHESGEIS